MKYSDIKTNIDISKLSQLYIEEKLSKEVIAKTLNICVSTLNKILKDFDITRQPLIKNKQPDKRFKSINESIDLEQLKRLYIEENKPYSYIRDYYKISGWTLDRLLRENNLNKSRKQSSEIVNKTKLEKYGLDNINNWKKGHKTRIDNYGSIEESYKQGNLKQQQTCLDRYGYACVLNSSELKNHRKKRDTIPNKKFATLLERYAIMFEQEFCLGTKAYDFKVNDTLIEINPTITHNTYINPYDKNKCMEYDYHLDKSIIAKQNNYRCIHVWDWDDKNKILNLLTKKQIIGARKCQLVELTKYNTDNFLNIHHLQNSCKGQTYRFGLKYKDELIQVMTFGKPRYNKKFDYELLRLCSHSNYIVVGGAEKLFKAFIQQFPDSKIISYCDNAKFNGNVYTKLGFSKITNGVPTKHWYCDKHNFHITDNLLRQQGFDRLLGDKFGCFGKGTDNEELMLMHGFLPVFDCGQSVFVYNKN